MSSTPYGPGNVPPFPAGLGARELTLDAPRTFHLPNWGKIGEAGRLRFLRTAAEQASMDPRIRQLAFKILRDARVEQRQYREQAAALLSWVQHNIAYINEPNEILQDPLYTLKPGVQAGDCDDLALLLAALFGAVALPWRFVLSGRGPDGAPILWVEGTTRSLAQLRARWGHIFVRVGLPAFAPKEWLYAEPTVKGVALGWDAVSQGGALTVAEGGRGVVAGVVGVLGAMLPGSGGALATTGKPIDWKAILAAVGVGIATTVGATLILDEIKAWRNRSRSLKGARLDDLPGARANGRRRRRKRR